MNSPLGKPELRGARDRAAEVRRSWSPAERKRRVGLPPDAPWALFRTFFCGETFGDKNHFERSRREWQPSPLVVPRPQ